MKLRSLKLVIIDPFVQEPAMNCTNRLSDLLNCNINIFYPSLFPMTGLNKLQPDALIILGSASHITQNLPWHQPLAESVAHFLEKGKPTLGLCFGHQLIANYYGCKVDYFKTPEDRETQSRTVTIDKKFGNIEVGETLELAVTHRQAVITLHKDFEVLGHGPKEYLSNDLIKHKKLPFIGSQPHPEASEYFCMKSAELPPEKVPIVQRDGDRLVLAFFKNYFD